MLHCVDGFVVTDKLGFAFRLVKADILGNVSVSFSVFATMCPKNVHYVFFYNSKWLRAC